MSATDRPRLAVGIATGWLLLELLFRWGIGVGLYQLLGSLVAADWLVLLVGVPIIAIGLTAVAVRAGQSPDTWEYRWTRRAVAVGVLGLLVAAPVLYLTAEIDAMLFGLADLEAEVESVAVEAIRATPILAVVLLLGNGIAVPIAEEHVWRGIVQTELVTAWGAVIGILLTASLFTLKHVIVDLSIVRLTTLFALAMLLGVARQCGGTTSAIVLHIGVNVSSSALLVYHALG